MTSSAPSGQVDQRLTTGSKQSHHPRGESSSRRYAPHLSSRGLTWLLVLMCFIPIVTVTSLWLYLPAVYEGQLLCSVTTAGEPDDMIYELPYRQRQRVYGTSILVRNNSEEEWTLINVMLNGHYQIYDTEALRPGEERAYLVDRFVGRTGARFEVRYNPLKNVKVYARRPGGDRATYYQDL